MRKGGHTLALDDPASGRIGPGSRSARRRAAIAGLMGTASVTLLLAVLHVLVVAVPFAPVALAQAFVRVPPASVTSPIIDVLAHWASFLAIAGTAIAFAGSGWVLGHALPAVTHAVRGSADVAGVLTLLPLWALAVVVYPEPTPPATDRWPFAAVTLPIFVASGILSGLVFRTLNDRAAGSSPQGGPSRSVTARVPGGSLESSPGLPATGSVAGAAPDKAHRSIDDGRSGPRTGPDPGRRYVVASVALGGAGILLGVTNVRRLLGGRPDPGEQLLRVPRLVPASPAPAVSDFEVPGLSPEVTPTEDFYVVDEELVDPDIDPASWRLSIGGLVEEPLDLTYGELKRFTVWERHQTLECISNQVGGRLISTAKWAGVRLRDIVERAGGLRSGAREVVFRATSGYSDSLSVEHAMDESTLIAIGMNGHVLPRAHGFPARLLSVGTYGMKNPKWLTSIEVVDHAYEGFWERRGWAKEAPVKTFSRIDTPHEGSRVSETVLIAGVAFAGDRGVAGVEVSTDAGRTWHPARVKPALSRYAWSLWLYRWTTPRGGRVRALVRAKDGDGQVQVSAFDDPFPNGASGLDSVMLAR